MNTTQNRQQSLYDTAARLASQREELARAQARSAVQALALGISEISPQAQDVTLTTNGEVSIRWEEPDGRERSLAVTTDGYEYEPATEDFQAATDRVELAGCLIHLGEVREHLDGLSGVRCFSGDDRFWQIDILTVTQEL